MCSRVFASRLDSFWTLYGVECYYVECLVEIASLYRLVLGIGIRVVALWGGIGILLGLVHHVSIGVSSTPSIIRLLRRDRSSRSISFSVRESGSRRSSSNSFPLAWSFPTSFYIFVSSSSGWPCVNSKLIAFSNSEIFCQVGCSYFLNVFY